MWIVEYTAEFELQLQQLPIDWKRREGIDVTLRWELARDPRSAGWPDENDPDAASGQAWVRPICAAEGDPDLVVFYVLSDTAVVVYGIELTEKPSENE